MEGLWDVIVQFWPNSDEHVQTDDTYTPDDDVDVDCTTDGDVEEENVESLQPGNRSNLEDTAGDVFMEENVQSMQQGNGGVCFNSDDIADDDATGEKVEYMEPGNCDVCIGSNGTLDNVMIEKKLGSMHIGKFDDTTEDDLIESKVEFKQPENGGVWSSSDNTAGAAFIEKKVQSMQQENGNVYSNSDDKADDAVVVGKVGTMQLGNGGVCSDKECETEAGILEGVQSEDAVVDDQVLPDTSDMTQYHAKSSVVYSRKDYVDSSKIRQHTKENTPIQYQKVSTELQHDNGKNIGIKISTTVISANQSTFEHKIDLVQPSYRAFRNIHLLQDGDIIKSIANMDVTVRHHCELIDILQDEFNEETIIFEMIIQRGNEFIKLEIENDVIDADIEGGGLGLLIHKIKKSKGKSTPLFNPLMCVEYKNESNCRLQQVNTEKYICVNSEGELKCEFQETFSDQSYEFRRFSYSAVESIHQRYGQKFRTVSLCLFQATKGNKYITAKGFKNVELKNYAVDKKVQGLKHPNTHFFTVWQTDSGSVLESLVIRRSNGDKGLFVVWNNKENKFQMRKETLDNALNTKEFLFNIISL